MSAFDMSRADELRRQIRRKRAEYRAQLAEGMEGAHAVMRLREIKQLEAELARIEGSGDQCE